MRVCVAGGGLAGALLAWRLAQQPQVSVDLLTGTAGSRDATGASGGAMRGFELLPRQRHLAIASMAELLASPVLQDWAGYRRTGFVYLPSDGDLAGAVADIDRLLPGSAALATAAAAFAGGPGGSGSPGSGTSRSGGPAWAGPPDVPAVVEREAGYIAPARLRDAAVADLARRGGRVTGAPLDALAAGPAGRAVVTAAGGTADYDAVVLAAGAWTPGLLRASGLPADGYRTKSICYSVYSWDGWSPPAFADDATGLYSKPTADGGLLLGVATTDWDVPPGRQPDGSRWHQRALDLARGLLPRLRLGPARSVVSAVDCYCDPPVLALRPVPAAGPGVFTFTGGSGGAAKTALAASSQAAAVLTGLGVAAR